MDPDRDRGLVAAARRSGCAALRVRIGDEWRELALSRRRRKWEALAELLGQLDWTSAELLDGEGALLASVAGEAPDPVQTQLPRESALLELLLRGQDVALARHERSVSVLLEGYTRLSGQLLERLTALERTYEEVLALARDSATRQEDGLDGAVGQALQAALPAMLSQKSTVR